MTLQSTLAKVRYSPSAASAASPESTRSRHIRNCVESLLDDEVPVMAYGQPSNGQALEDLMADEVTRSKVQALLWQQGYHDTQQFLRLWFCPEASSERLFIPEQDLQQVLSRFGQIGGFAVQGETALVLFNSPVSAFFAYRCLDNLFLPDLQGRLLANLLSPEEQQTASQELGLGEGRGSMKFTCRFLIPIANERQFQVARRIIGNKGGNMKKVIDSCAQLVRSKENEVVKLRLRGKGSGYREGPNQAQSEQPLHLCVSSRFEQAYRKACDLVQDLLGRVYNDYRQFCRRNRKNCPPLSVQRMESQPPLRILDLTAECPLGQPLTECLIARLIEARNCARRVLNFEEADRIRQFLRSRGVSVVDEKGGRGSGAEVTSWRFIAN